MFKTCEESVTMSWDVLAIACSNIGFDITCGACVSVFFTGSNDAEHDLTCKTNRMSREQVDLSNPLIINNG